MAQYDQGGFLVKGLAALRKPSEQTPALSLPGVLAPPHPQPAAGSMAPVRATATHASVMTDTTSGCWGGS
jgi:hypothetical protein